MKLTESISIPVQALKNNGLRGITNIIYAFFNLKNEPPEMSSQPLIVQIEPTTYCNLECQMCLSPISDRIKRHLRFEEFKKIIDDIPLLRKISLVGAGEPLLNPELFDMVTYAKTKGISIGFATNGLLLGEDNCRKIIDSRLNWINISIDSIKKDNYESIRKGADFDELLFNVKRLIMLRGRRKIPEILLWFVTMRQNLNELPRIIEFAKSIGIKQVATQLGHDWGSEQLKKIMPEPSLATFTEEIIPVLRQAKITARKNKIKFDYVNIPNKFTKRACKWPWKSCYITCDGFVTPCCVRGSDPKIFNLGNVFKESFLDIWNNRIYQGFRKELNSDSVPYFCVSCPSYYKRLKV